MDFQEANISDNSTTPDGRRMYSLLELSSSITSIINKTYKSTYWIRAEIAKLNYYSKTGHCYPDLVEKKDGLILAQMRAIIWAKDYKLITAKFLEVTKNPLNEGMTILMRGSLSYHAVYGFSFSIADIEASFSLGEMAKEKMETINRLKRELIYERNKNLIFPVIPQKIAVISVESSKGYSDFINILSANDRKYKFDTTLFPAILQGDRAVASILAQLKKIKIIAEKYDIICIIRGGGGDIGLNCYDSYELAKEIACFPIPVVTGIGHSTNETVAEMISHTNKITPTDVAYFLIRKFSDFDEKINGFASVISSFAMEIIGQQKNGIAENIRVFRNSSLNQLARHGMVIDNCNGRLKRESILCIKRTGNVLENLSSGLKYKPESRIKQEQFRLENMLRLIFFSIKQNLRNHQSGLLALDQRMRLLDPVNIMKRGYSISYHSGKVIRDITEVNANDEIVTEFQNGRVISIVKDKDFKKENPET